MTNISPNRFNLLKKLYYDNINLAITINGERKMPSSNKCISMFIYKKNIIEIGLNKTGKINLGMSTLYNHMRSKLIYPPKFNIHSELAGYMKVLYNEKDFNIILNYRGDTFLSPSKPCIICSKWLNKLRNVIICYIDENNKFDCKYSNDLEGHVKDLSLLMNLMK